MTTFRIEKLAKEHTVEGFDCGQDALNRFLIRYAWQNQQANAVQTYLGLTEDVVVGFYSLVVGEVAFDDAPARLKKGLAHYPVPIMLLARMGVSVTWQGRDLGKGLLRDAMQRTVQAADLAGIRAFAVHVKDENARQFYEHFNFMPSPTDPLHLLLLVKDLRRVAGLA